MALQKQVIPIVFGQGIDTKTDSKQLKLGTLKSAKNVVYESIFAYRKRNGYDSIVLQDTVGVPIQKVKALTHYKDELNIFANDHFYSYSEALKKVTDKGLAYTARPTNTAIINNSYNHSNVDSIAVQGLNIFCYTNSSLNECHYSVQDATNGSLLVSYALVGTNAQFARLASINNFVYLIWVSGTNVLFKRFSVFNPTVLSSVTVLANNINATTPTIDAISNASMIIIAYNAILAGPVNQLTLATITQNGQVGNGFGVSTTNAVAIDLSVDALNRVVIAYADATTVNYAVVNLNLQGYAVTPRLLETVSGCTNISGLQALSLGGWNATLNTPVLADGVGIVGDSYVVSIAGVVNLGSGAQTFAIGNLVYFDGRRWLKSTNALKTSYRFYYEIGASLPSNHFVKRISADLQGNVSYVQIYCRSVGLAAKLFSINGKFYVPVAFQTTLQSTYFVLDEASSVVAKISPDLGGGLVLNGSLPHVGYTSATQRAFPNLIKGINVSDGGTFYSLLGINNTILDFAPINPYMTAVLGENLHLAGGALQMYDGNSVVEHGFHYYPENLVSNSVAPGGGQMVNGGTYGYVALYRWTDNAGQEHRSVPSLPLSITVTGSGASSGTWATSVPITVTTVSTGSGRNGNTVTLTVASPAPNPPGKILINVTGSAAAVNVQVVPATGANNGGTFLNLTTAQLANFLQTGSAPGGGISFTVADSSGLLSDLRATGGGTQVLTNGGEGDGQIATLANGGVAQSASISVPTLRLTAKTSVVLELYRTENAGTIYHLATSAVVPIFNDKTVDSIIINDGLSDALLIQKQVLYTTGGVLENDAAPAANIVAVHTSSNRLFLAGLEDKHSVAYSKFRNPRQPVEFSSALQIAIDPVGGNVTALQSMDEKMIIFASDAVFYVAGQGPNNAGQQDTFVQPERISTEVGCIQPNSLVLLPEGIIFQSRKGIYMLSRNLQLSYIGAPVQGYNNLTITSGKLLGKLNQVRFTTSNGDCLVYNYYLNQWATFDNHQALGAEVLGDSYYYVRLDGVLFKENSTIFGDNGSPISMQLETGWMSFAGLQGFQRAYGMNLLGDFKSSHKLRIRVAYNFNEAFTQELLIDTADFITSTTYGSVSPYGAESPYGGDGTALQVRVDFATQKCQAIKLYIADEQSVVGEGLSLSGMGLEVGGKQGLGKLNQGQSYGTK